MALKLYNTLSRSLEEFKPLKETVGLYTCGPTVYNYPHIGNYRAYIFGDMLKRQLEYTGFRVEHVMNITDIDDKTIRDSQAQGKSLLEFTEFYTKAFFEDRDMLNIIPANIYTKATEYIPEMITLIETLIDKGYAYKEADGSVYFNIHKDTHYGKLSHFNLEDLKENAKGRLKKDEYDKDNAQDFALWKSWDENDGDVFWKPDEILARETLLGKGRPGWHIECSAMSMDVLGETFDIHTGGVDNIFPHHENEIAQSECATGKTFANYFMHNEHLLVDGQKMSKSLGNFYTLRDLIDKGFSPVSFRYLMYSSHYRTKTNFTLEALEASKTALRRLQQVYLDIINETDGMISQTYAEKLRIAMDNDLDSPKALSILWELAHDKELSNNDKKATLLDFDRVFGFGLSSLEKETIPEEVKILADEREKARLEKNWAKSDELRAGIEKLGYEVKDTDGGYKVSKI
jgi:cysteinyl-tRNA synthetase